MPKGIKVCQGKDTFFCIHYFMKHPVKFHIGWILLKLLNMKNSFFIVPSLYFTLVYFFFILEIFFF